LKIERAGKGRKKYKERQRFFQEIVTALCGTRILQAVSRLFVFFHQLMVATPGVNDGPSDSTAFDSDAN
jgi:hypothetical protein